MTEKNDIERFRPPESPLDMPFQVIEREGPLRLFLSLLRLLEARRAPHE